MNRFFARTALCGAFIFCGMTAANAGSGDSRRLTSSETRDFVRLACEGSVPTKDGYRCSKLLGYPGGSRISAQDTLSLSAVAYGAFTESAADQAYVSYSGSFEPHANNFGGGILFARAGGAWKLVGWYPGHQMDDCIGLPSQGRQKMLCLSGYTGMGETTSTVSVETIPRSGADRSTKVLLRAEDSRGDSEESAGWDCSKRLARDEAVLLSIDSLRRAKSEQFVADAKITYATAADVRNACRRAGGKPRTTAGVVHIEAKGGTVQTVTGLRFASNDE